MSRNRSRSKTGSCLILLFKRLSCDDRACMVYFMFTQCQQGTAATTECTTLGVCCSMSFLFVFVGASVDHKTSLSNGCVCRVCINCLRHQKRHTTDQKPTPCWNSHRRTFWWLMSIVPQCMHSRKNVTVQRAIVGSPP